MSRAVGTTFTKRVPAFAPTCVVEISKQGDGGAALGTADSGATTTAAATGDASLSRTPSAWNLQGPLHQQQYLRSGRDQYPRRRKRPRDNWSIGKSEADRVAEIAARLDHLQALLQNYFAHTVAARPPSQPGQVERLQAPCVPVITIKGRNSQAKALMALAQAYPDYAWEDHWGEKRFTITGRDAYRRVLEVLKPLGRIEHLPTGETP
jgi:hypothetical protein